MVSFPSGGTKENHLIEAPILVETDSQGFTDYIYDQKVNCRTTHISRKFYFIKYDYEEGNICFTYKNTKNLEADVY